MSQFSGGEGAKTNCKYLSVFRYGLLNRESEKEQVYDIFEFFRKSISEYNMKF